MLMKTTLALLLLFGAVPIKAQDWTSPSIGPDGLGDIFGQEINNAMEKYLQEQWAPAATDSEHFKTLLNELSKNLNEIRTKTNPPTADGGVESLSISLDKVELPKIVAWTR